MEQKQSIVLVGFMGAGKSSVGARLSARLGFPLIDTDTLIEQNAGRKISEIFARDGETAFRVLETEMLRSLVGQRAVFATGGGIVTRPENWPLLKQLGIVVHLHGSAEVLFDRVKDEGHRPLLSTENPRETFASLLRMREALYQQADFTIDTDGKTPDGIVDELLRITMR